MIKLDIEGNENMVFDDQGKLVQCSDKLKKQLAKEKDANGNPINIKDVK